MVFIYLFILFYLLWNRAWVHIRMLRKIKNNNNVVPCQILRWSVYIIAPTARKSQIWPILHLQRAPVPMVLSNEDQIWHGTVYPLFTLICHISSESCYSVAREGHKSPNLALFLLSLCWYYLAAQRQSWMRMHNNICLCSLSNDIKIVSELILSYGDVAFTNFTGQKKTNNELCFSIAGRRSSSRTKLHMVTQKVPTIFILQNVFAPDV